MSVNEVLKQAEKDFGLGGSTFKFQEGVNKFRILSDFAALQSEYKGNKSVKFLAHVLDRKDAKVKLAFFPYSIAKVVAEYEASEDYGFKSFPMPYDITVKAEDAGKITVNYIPTPGKETALTAEEQALVADLEPIDDVRHRIHEEQTKKAVEAATSAGGDITAEYLPE